MISMMDRVTMSGRFEPCWVPRYIHVDTLLNRLVFDTTKVLYD